MYRELISQHCEDAEFAPPAAWADLEIANERLHVALPEALRAALRESNGILGEYELGLLWPIERIVSENLAFRSNADFRQLYMPFDCLLFFADAGNGDQFAYVITSAGIERGDIFVWKHECDSRSWVAPNLGRYFEWWLTGEILL